MYLGSRIEAEFVKIATDLNIIGNRKGRQIVMGGDIEDVFLGMIVPNGLKDKVQDALESRRFTVTMP